MITCKACKEHIEHYLDGTLSNIQRNELTDHIDTCESCHQEYQQYCLLQEVVTDAFSPQTEAEQAQAALEARISHEPMTQGSTPTSGPVFLMWVRRGVAAIVLLGIGLTLGLGWAKVGSIPPEHHTGKVSIQVTQLTGTVLVRHQDNERWHRLHVDSTIHLGDRFYATAGSNCVFALDKDSTLELTENSNLVLDAFNGPTQFTLTHGQLDAILESPHPPFYINTPYGRVEALGTEFSITVTDK